MIVDPKSPEGKVFFERYEPIVVKTATRKTIASYASRTDELHCLTPGAAKKIVAEIKRELAAKSEAAPAASVEIPKAKKYPQPFEPMEAAVAAELKQARQEMLEAALKPTAQMFEQIKQDLVTARRQARQEMLNELQKTLNESLKSISK
jgi:hypothetical protein